jgi:hypothetical protein
MQHVSSNQVDLAMAGLIYYGMHQGMLLRYSKGKYTVETRKVYAILEKVSPFIDPDDVKHIERIIKQGCPSLLQFDKDTLNKLAVINKGNQQMFEAHLEIMENFVNKEEKKQPCPTFQMMSCLLLTFPLLHPPRIAQKERKVLHHLWFLNSNLDE